MKTKTLVIGISLALPLALHSPLVMAQGEPALQEEKEEKEEAEELEGEEEGDGEAAQTAHSRQEETEELESEEEGDGEAAQTAQPRQENKPGKGVKSAQGDKPAQEDKPAAASRSDKKPRKKGVTILKRAGQKSEPSSFAAIGASTMDREQTALRISVGYPELHVMYHMPWDTDIELAAGGGLFYGLNAHTVGKLTGPMAVGEARWRIYHEKEHSIALVARPNVGVRFDRDWVFGMTFGLPGMVYDRSIKGEHHLVFGFHIPWGLFGSPNGVSVRIPMVFEGGGEYAMTANMHFFGTLELGADIWAGNTPLKAEVLNDTAYLFLRVLGGVALVL